MIKKKYIYIYMYMYNQFFLHLWVIGLPEGQCLLCDQAKLKVGGKLLLNIWAIVVGKKNPYMNCNITNESLQRCTIFY